MDIGDCFVNKPGRNTPSHLWIVLSDPNADPDNVLIVNLTDADKHHDDSCIMTNADHAWLDKESVVAYQWSKITSVVDLANIDGRGLLDHKHPLSSGALQRVLDGAYASDELTGARRELLRRQGLID